MHPVQITLDVHLLGITVFSAFSDVWKQKIYDWVTIHGLFSGLLLQCMAFGVGEAAGLGLLSAISGAFVCGFFSGFYGCGTVERVLEMLPYGGAIALYVIWATLINFQIFPTFPAG